MLVERQREVTMKLTNRHGLPQSLVNAVLNDDYSRGASDISVTQLIDEPRVRLMKMKHSEEVEEDVADHLWSLLGKSFHSLMEDHTEDNDDTIIEERMFIDVNGWVLSGQLDLAQGMKTGNPFIRDYKVTSVYSVMQVKADWERQVNTYRYMFWKTHGIFPGGQIIAMCRDWRPREAQQRRNDGYPQTPVVAVAIPQWTLEQCQEYVEGRVRLHQDAQAHYDNMNQMPLCREEGRWADPDKWAVMRRGAKRAVKLFTDEQEAYRYAATMKRTQGMNAYVERRPGGNRRCEGYCAFAPMCDQFKVLQMKSDVIQVHEAVNGDKQK